VHLELLVQGINLTNELHYDARDRSGSPSPAWPGRVGYTTISTDPAAVANSPPIAERDRG